MQAWRRRLNKLPVLEHPQNGEVVYVLRSEDEEIAAVTCFRDGKELEKAVTDHYRPIEAILRRAQTKKKQLKDADLEHVSPVLRRLNDGIVAYRREIERAKVEEARRVAEAERARQEAEQRAAAERLRAEAEALKGAARKDVLAEAAAVEHAPIQSVEAVVAEVRDEVTSQFRGRGRAATRQRWSAAVDNLADLVCAIVASSPALVTRVGEIKRAIAKGEADTVSIQAVQAYLPELNRRATSQRDQLRIPGVRAVCSENIANT